MLRTRVRPRRSQDQGRAIAQDLAVAALQRCDVIAVCLPPSAPLHAHPFHKGRGADRSIFEFLTVPISSLDSLLRLVILPACYFLVFLLPTYKIKIL